MIISFEHRFVFIANPKTASVSIEAALRPYGEGYPKPPNASPKQLQLWKRRAKTNRHMGWPVIRRLYGEELTDSFTFFAVKRDPVDRLLSFYFFRQRGEIADPESRHHKNYVGERSLDEYLDAIETGELERPRSQLQRVTSETGELKATLLRFEHLQEDLTDICRQIGLPEIQLPHRNPSQKRSGFKEEQLTPEQYRRIVTLYADDIISLGYADKHPLAREVKTQAAPEEASDALA